MLPPGELAEAPPKIGASNDIGGSSAHPAGKPLLLYLPILILGCAAFAAAALKYGLPLPRCAFKAHLGIPCPFCGSTRALASLANGEFFTAIAFNPLVTMLALASFAVWFLPQGWATIRPGRKFQLIFGASVLVNWLYLIIHLP